MKMVFFGIVTLLTLGCVNQVEGVNAPKYEQPEMKKQEKKNVSCEDSLILQIVKNGYTVPSEKNELGITYSQECLAWFNDMISEETKRYTLGDSIYLFKSRMYGATGLMSNFYNYMIYDGRVTYTFISLSDKESLVYLDEEGHVAYVTIDYSENFLNARDWDNVELILKTYMISGSTVNLVSEESKICD